MNSSSPIRLPYRPCTLVHYAGKLRWRTKLRSFSSMNNYPWLRDISLPFPTLLSHFPFSYAVQGSVVLFCMSGSLGCRCLVKIGGYSIYVDRLEKHLAVSISIRTMSPHSHQPEARTRQWHQLPQASTDQQEI